MTKLIPTFRTPYLHFVFYLIYTIQLVNIFTIFLRFIKPGFRNLEGFVLVYLGAKVNAYLGAKT